MERWWGGASLSAPARRSTSRIRTATTSSSSPVDGQGQQGAHQALGRNRPALGRGLQQAALGRAHDDRGHCASVQIVAKPPGSHAFRQDVLEGEPDLLPLPGEGQAELLVVPGPGPPGQEEPGEVAIPLPLAAQHPRRQVPEEGTNWKGSIATRKRFSVPGEDMRPSNGLEPREGTTPKTKARPRLTTRPFSSSPSTPTITRSHEELAPLRTSPYTSSRPLPTRSVVKLTARREGDRGA